MQVFKCALRIIRGNFIYPLIYIVGLSLMGLLMATSFDFGSAPGTFERESYDFAVIDRDGSALSAAVQDHLAKDGTEVVVKDDEFAIQDAVAKGMTDYLLIVPEGFQEDFIQAAHAGEEPPKMDTIYSFYSMEGALVDQSVGEYLGIIRTLMATSPDRPIAEITNDAEGYASDQAHVSVIETSSAISEADRFVFYLQWSTYTLFAGITVCVGMLVCAMGRSDVRRRNLASPVTFASYNLQLGLACFTVTLAAWAWTFFLGMTAFPEAVSQITVSGLILCALSMLSFCLIPLAVGFLLGQGGASNVVCNAVGNIVGMVVSFFGGAWISLSLMSPEVETLAHWLPGYWYANACSLAAHEGAAQLQRVLGDAGVLLLFAVALGLVGLLVGRMRTQTSD